MFYLPTKGEVNLWTNKVTVVMFVPLPAIWLKVLGSLRPRGSANLRHKRLDRVKSIFVENI